MAIVDIRHYSDDYRLKPIKESHAFVLKEIARGFKGTHLLDVGCAAGEFLYHAEKRFPHLGFAGIDTAKPLLERAKQLNYRADFQWRGIADTKGWKLDIVTLLGVHTSFKTVDEWLKPVLAMNANVIYVFGIFNPYDINVAIEMNSPKKTAEFYIPSLPEIRKKLAKAKRSYTVKPFYIKKDIKPNPYDAYRAWTFKNEWGERLQTNGACMLLPFKLLTISSRAT